MAEAVTFPCPACGSLKIDSTTTSDGQKAELFCVCIGCGCQFKRHFTFVGAEVVRYPEGDPKETLLKIISVLWPYGNQEKHWSPDDFDTIVTILHKNGYGPKNVKDVKGFLDNWFSSEWFEFTVKDANGWEYIEPLKPITTFKRVVFFEPPEDAEDQNTSVRKTLYVDVNTENVGIIRWEFV